MPLSLAMDDGELDNVGGNGGCGGPPVVAAMAAAAAVAVVDNRVGVLWRRWQGRLMVVAAWQHSAVAIDYSKAMSGQRWHLTVAVVGGKGI